MSHILHKPQLKQNPFSALKDVITAYVRMKNWLAPNAPFRPPRGKTHLLIMAWLKKTNKKVLWWTHDSGDTHQHMPHPQKLVDDIKKFQGGVVLMHCLHKDKVRQDYVIETTRRLIKISIEENYKCCTASEYLHIIS